MDRKQHKEALSNIIMLLDTLHRDILDEDWAIEGDDPIELDYCNATGILQGVKNRL